MGLQLVTTIVTTVFNACLKHYKYRFLLTCVEHTSSVKGIKASLLPKTAAESSALIHS